MEPLTQAQQELFDWLVNYIRDARHAPSIRQMMRAMRLRSPAPVQSRLNHLRRKGYIDWQEGRARTLRILHPSAPPQGIPVLGAIAAGGVVETFTDVQEAWLFPFQKPAADCFALRVVGDSMIGACITDGDLVIMGPVRSPEALMDGEIVAAQVSGHGTTLKHFHRQDQGVMLRSANPHYPPLVFPEEQVTVQGKLLAVWRNYGL